MTGKRLFAIIASATLATATPAFACPPPPPPPAPEPGETTEAHAVRMEAFYAEGRRKAAAWRMQSQADAWDSAGGVMLAKIERVSQTMLRNDRGEIYGTSPLVRLRPVRWLKGDGPERSFTLAYEGLTSCGPYGGGEAVDGRVDEEFVVFTQPMKQPAKPRRDSIAVANIVEPRIRTALSGE